MKIRTILAAAAACLVLPASSSAAVTFDEASGTGFVGKGDVQLALGLNNAALQRTAASLAFAWSSSETYEASCQWLTGEGTRGEKTHTKTRSRTASVNAAVLYDSRQRNQITGFTLTGFSTIETVGDEAPVVGSQCHGDGVDGTWVSVTIIESMPGTLTVNGVSL